MSGCSWPNVWAQESMNTGRVIAVITIEYLGLGFGFRELLPGQSQFLCV